MNVATWSIRNPIPAILLFLLLTLAGLWGFRSLNIQEFPDLDFPAVTVTLTLPGAAPSQLETEVARRVEDSIATLEGVKHQATSITDGQVTIIVEFELGKVLSDALVDVKDAVDRVRADLPQDLEEPQVTKITIGPGGPILTYAISSDSMDEEALSWFTDDTVARAILGVPGVGRFERVGGVQREVQVNVDPVRLQALNVTAVDISRALKRVQQEASGGRGQLSGAEQGMRTIATVRQSSDLAALPIALADGRSIRLDQVADVIDTIAERTQAALLDGKPAIGFQVSRSKGYDETEIAAGVEQALAELRQKHVGLHVELIRSGVAHTHGQYRASMEMLYEGAFLAVLVIWWFLRDWRATLIGAAALPLSIIPTFAVMYWMGYALNGITLLALAVVVGILVDDAIVEVENIAEARPGGQACARGDRGSSQRDRARSARHDGDARRRLSAHRLHGRRARPRVQAVRLDDRRCGDRVADGGSARDADDGRVADPARSARAQGKRADGALPASRRLVSAASVRHDGRGHSVFLHVARADSAAANRLHPCGRRGKHLRQRGTASWSASYLHGVGRRGGTPCD